MKNIKTMTATDFQALCSASSPFIIDVRTPDEFRTVHVEGAQLFPLQELRATQVKKAQDSHDGDQECVYILCKGGKRAEMAAKQLSDYLVCDLVVVDGGTDACVQNGMPVRAGDTPG